MHVGWRLDKGGLCSVRYFGGWCTLHRGGQLLGLLMAFGRWLISIFALNWWLCANMWQFAHAGGAQYLNLLRAAAATERDATCCLTRNCLRMKKCSPEAVDGTQSISPAACAYPPWRPLSLVLLQAAARHCGGQCVEKHNGAIVAPRAMPQVPLTCSFIHAGRPVWPICQCTGSVCARTYVHVGACASYALHPPAYPNLASPMQWRVATIHCINVPGTMMMPPSTATVCCDSYCNLNLASYTPGHPEWASMLHAPALATSGHGDSHQLLMYVLIHSVPALDGTHIAHASSRPLAKPDPHPEAHHVHRDALHHVQGAHGDPLERLGYCHGGLRRAEFSSCVSCCPLPQCRCCCHCCLVLGCLPDGQASSRGRHGHGWAASSRSSQRLRAAGTSILQPGLWAAGASRLLHPGAQLGLSLQWMETETIGRSGLGTLKGGVRAPGGLGLQHRKRRLCRVLARVQCAHNDETSRRREEGRPLWRQRLDNDLPSGTDVSVRTQRERQPRDGSG